MDDAAFLKALERGTFPKEEMNHRAHLRLALLCRDDPQHARDLLQLHAVRAGQAVKFNETLTQVWIRLVAAHPEKTTVEALMKTPLGDANLPLRHYSHERLWS